MTVFLSSEAIRTYLKRKGDLVVFFGGESPSLWTNNSNLIGVLRKSFESYWEKPEKNLRTSFLL